MGQESGQGSALTHASDYSCLAMVEVPADKVTLYDQLICKAASIFTTHGWRLLVAAENSALFDTTGAPPGLQRTLLQLWSIPDFDSLPKVMAYAADDPSYVKAQALTVGERQNLYTILRWDNPIGLPDTPVKYYMMESLSMVNGDQARDDFANYMDNAVYKMNSSYGWKILFAGNATTGVLNEYVNLWGMADTATLDAAITEYRSNTAWASAVARVSTSMWTPRSLPCFDELSSPAAAPAKTE
jgi:hypothetical protein